MTAKPVPEHISDERLAELRSYARLKEDACLRDEALLTAKQFSDFGRALTELQHRREAEAVAWRWRYDDPAAPGKKLGWFFGPIEPPPNALGRSWSGWECEPLSAASPSSPASGVRVIGYVTEEALKLMLTVKPKSGWHYHMFAKDQADAEATIAIYASDAEALSALGEHP